MKTPASKNLKEKSPTPVKAVTPVKTHQPMLVEAPQPLKHNFVTARPMIDSPHRLKPLPVAVISHETKPAQKGHHRQHTLSAYEFLQQAQKSRPKLLSRPKYD
jgi:hypothetical protein